MIKITPIETGKARMNVAQMAAAEGRSALGRKIDIFRDTRWVEPLPIYAYLIEHPEGL
jgi:N-acyl homoserine lactone hydrolase